MGHPPRAATPLLKTEITLLEYLVFGRQRGVPLPARPSLQAMWGFGQMPILFQHLSYWHGTFFFFWLLLWLCFVLFYQTHIYIYDALE